LGRWDHHRYSPEHGWTYCYLVSLKLYKKLDIYDFVEDIAYQFTAEVIKTYTFSLVEKLKSYTDTVDSADTDLLDTIKFILTNECDLKLDKNYKSIIKKNTSISIKEAVYEVLKRHKKSLDINQICTRMFRTYQYQQSEENRNVLIKYLDKNPLVMSYINVSTGCKEWMIKIPGQARNDNTE
jgi:hypothetical protein